MDEATVWGWVAKQGSIVMAFAIGVWSGHFFTKTVFNMRTQLETERYNHVTNMLDQLREDMKESERVCSERLERVEKKYSDDLLVIKELAESNERKALAMITSMGRIVRDNAVREINESEQ